MMDGAISGFMIDLGIQGVEGSWSVENSLLDDLFEEVILEIVRGILEPTKVMSTI